MALQSTVTLDRNFFGKCPVHHRLLLFDLHLNFISFKLLGVPRPLPVALVQGELC